MSPAPTPSLWWLRLHGALMPDYNRRAAVYWLAVVALGGVLLADNLISLRGLSGTGWLQIVVASGFAVLVGLFPVRLPGTRQSFVAGEIFLFLLLLLQGPAAAALAAGTEALVGSWRTSRRWTSRLISPAVAVLSMNLAGALPAAALRTWDALDKPALLVAVMLLFAALNALITIQMIAGVPRLKRAEPFVQWAELLRVFRWVGLAYLGSAVMASLLYLSQRQSGIGVLLVVLPVMVLLIMALHYYFLQQEAALAMQDAVGRAAEAAESHRRELQASEQRFQSAFQHAAIGMALLDFDGRVLQANAALRTLLGLADGDTLPAQFQAVVEARDQAALQEQLTAGGGAAGVKSVQRELRCLRSDGQTVWVLAHCGYFTEPQTGSPCLILQLQDISARRKAEAGLQRMAFQDSLTGLANRRQFLDSLADVVARHRVDAGAAFAVMYLDFDRFKRINDSLGHAAGDELLVQMARRVQDNLRPSDVVARLGGDEFAVLLPLPRGDHDAELLAERLVEAMRQPFDVAGHTLLAGASIGITFSRFGYDSADAVLRDADSAMYRAKALGKGRYALFEPGQPSAPSERLPLEADLRQALDAGLLSLAYQPQFDLASGRPSGFEALARWQHPRHGAIGPAVFVPVAEEAGLIDLLSDFVLRSACAQLRTWQQLDPAWSDLTVSVNLSGQDLADRGFPAQVAAALRASGLAPQHLVLELSEVTVMSHLDSAVANLQVLRALGVQLSMDDVGTGSASLPQLVRVPVDSLKINPSVVRVLVEGSGEFAVVQAVLALGDVLGKRVVAGGIETGDQAAQLRRMGCHWGQGFHLSHPLTAPDATAWLLSHGARGAMH